MEDAVSPPVPPRPALAGNSAEALVAPPGLRHPVLVGYNGSRSSDRALAYATGMAARLGRPLLIVYVRAVYFSPLSGQVIMAASESDATGWLLGSIDRIHCEGPLFVAVRRGDPAGELARVAAEYDADAIVVGTSGRRARLSASSIPRSLARGPRCPVIVVP
jgi:nucleotide-binding universal stress UspA family protein